jgi:protease-4
VLTASVEDAYRVFVGKVAESRKLSFEQADGIARGRVWIGADARERGLVDRIGGLDEAIAAAAARAGLDEGTYGRRYVQPELSLLQRMAAEFGARAVRAADRMGILPAFAGLRGPGAGMVGVAVERLDRELTLLSRFNDPRDIYAHCLCVID